MVALYLGYDPGGGGTHGVAALDGADAVCTTVATANDAIGWFRDRCREREPIALGVDTLTMWSTGPAGWRPADRALKAAYPAVDTSVTAPNSLYGAMAINGVAVVMTLHRTFTSMKITETHPKVLYFALTDSPYDFEHDREQMVHRLVQWAGLKPCDVPDDHAWDALLSAFAARQWDTGQWLHDLHLLPSSEGELLIPAHRTTAHFAWPNAAPHEAAMRDTGSRPSMSSTRSRDRWRIAVDRLRRAGHDDVAQQVEAYRNVRNERAGWDSWLKSRFPAVWRLVEGDV